MRSISSRCILHWRPRTLVASMIDRVINRVETRHETSQWAASVYKHVVPRRKVWSSWQGWSSKAALSLQTLHQWCLRLNKLSSEFFFPLAFIWTVLFFYYFSTEFVPACSFFFHFFPPSSKTLKVDNTTTTLKSRQMKFFKGEQFLNAGDSFCVRGNLGWTEPWKKQTSSTLQWEIFTKCSKCLSCYFNF